MAGPGAAGFDGVLQRLDGKPAILSPGVWLKRYPCCASTHRPVDGLLSLMRMHKLAAADISHVEVLVSEAAVRNLMYAKPDNVMEARFSMPFCIAAAAHDLDLNLGTFQSSSLGRADVAAFIPRVTMVSDPKQPADMPSTVKNWAATTITTADDHRFTTTIIDPKGYPGNPLSEQELENKFRDCGFRQAAALGSSYSDWRSVNSAAKVRPLCAFLRHVGS